MIHLSVEINLVRPIVISLNFRGVSFPWSITYNVENLNKILKILLLFLSFIIKKVASSQEESLVEVTYVLCGEKLHYVGFL